MNKIELNHWISFEEFSRYDLDNLYSAGNHKQKQILFLTWIMMVVEFLGMRVACCEVFLCMTQRGKLFFLFLGHALKNLWVCDLWWMGRKSKYVIEVLEEFTWWATKVFLSIAWENDDVLYSPCITVFHFLSQKIFLNDTSVTHKCWTLEFASDIHSKNANCLVV